MGRITEGDAPHFFCAMTVNVQVCRVVATGAFDMEVIHMPRSAIPISELGKEYGDVINAEQLRMILGLRSRKTIDCWVAAGRLDGCFRRRGKHNLIVRERALDRIFNGPAWPSNNE